MVPDGADEIGQSPSGFEVGPRLTGDPFEQEVRPERRPDEAHVVHRHRPWVERRHAVLQALPRELASPDIDFQAVVLVVPRDVEGLVGAAPLLGDVADSSGAPGRDRLRG